MDREMYKELVKKHTLKETKIKNALVSFLVGGLVCLSAEILKIIFSNCFSISLSTSSLISTFIIIFFSSLFTALGFFDTWVSRLKCGLIIPTTGFAHSVTSSALEYKKDGFIMGLGANFFRLAGSVILYGIISAFILVLVKVYIWGV